MPGRFKRANLSNKVNDLRLISESSSIGVFTREFLARMNEYRSSGVTSAIDFGAIDSCRYLPINFDSKRKLSLKILQKDSFESLIDQYIILKEVLLETDLSSIPTSIKDKILQLSFLVDDNELIEIFNENPKPKKIITDILNDYTKGWYSHVIKRIEYLLENSENDFLGLLEVYARSKIYTGNLAESKTFFEVLANELAGILQCDKTTVDKVNFLKRVIFKFKLESWAKSLNFHLLSALEEIHDSHEIELVRLQTKVLGELNTPKAMLKDYKFTAFTNFDSITPEHRLLKYGQGSKKPHIDRALFPINSDFVKLQSYRLIELGLYVEAINFCIKEYLSNNMSAIHLPLAELCGYVDDISKTSNYDYFSCLVVYDIMARVNNNNFEELKTELFEELMRINKSHRPSLVFEKKEYTQVEAYFLNNICIPSQLDNFTDYISNDDVVHERIAILDLLINANIDYSDEIKKEKDNVLENLFSEKLRAKLESGKLYVDVQSLISKKKYIYNMYFELAKDLKGGVTLTPLAEEDTINSEDIFHFTGGNAIASSEKMELLFTIFTSIVSDFTLDENFGLDKYLSAEIRHVVFTTQLRSCFEKTRLVTIKKNGEYLSNTYWREKYKYININLVDQLDEMLKVFSKTIDTLLSEVNERFRVATSEINPQHIFDYTAYHHRLVRVSEIINDASNSDEFIKKLINYMWELTAENARNAQNMINDYLSNHVTEALDSLEIGIQTVKRDAAIVELMQEIKNARSLFTNEVEIVLNWFRFVGSDDNKNFERLTVVNEATLSSFESVYGHKYLKPEFSQSKSDISLNYRESRALFISIFTALENACKYGDPRLKSKVSHSQDEIHNFIKITNDIFNLSVKEAKEIVAREKEKWNENHADLNFKEGGSGLYKINSILKNSSDGFKFDINIEDNNFVAIIEMNNENFSNRR